jgi:hypothetical protein
MMSNSSSSSSSTTATTTTYERRPVAEENLTANSNQQDIADALRPHYKNQTPVVLRGAIVTAPAIEKWQSLDYLQETVGDDEMGCVEIGGSYGSIDADRPEIPFVDYLQYIQLFEERHGRHGNDDSWDLTNVPPKEELVYMAQNDVPAALYKDVLIPAFCDDSEYNVGLGRLYQAMLWLGPRGCVSPLHYDPLDNCLMQLVGRKRVLLFPPVATSETETGTLWHYAGAGGQQSNTSPVNVESATCPRMCIVSGRFVGYS